MTYKPFRKTAVYKQNQKKFDYWINEERLTTEIVTTPEEAKRLIVLSGVKQAFTVI